VRFQSGGAEIIERTRFRSPDWCLNVTSHEKCNGIEPEGRSLCFHQSVVHQSNHAGDDGGGAARAADNPELA
jgi:hypothetical protein